MPKKRKLKNRGSDKKGELIKSPSTISQKRSDHKEHPLFGFRYLDKNFCISKCNRDEKAALSDTFRKLGSMSWGQIRTSGRHASGYEQISISSLKGSIPRHVTDDALVIAFRFSGKKAMVGYKESGVFHLLKVDRNFTVYAH